MQGLSQCAANTLLAIFTLTRTNDFSRRIVSAEE